MKKRLLLGAGIVLVLGIGLVFALPASRYRILAYVHNERLYNGRPLGYWLTALKNEDAEVRREAALTLGEPEVLKDHAQDSSARQQVIARLVETLGDQDGFVRKCAATSFWVYPRDAAVPQDSAALAILTGALGDQEAMVRKAAARALWQAGAAAKIGDGVARLTAALGDKDDAVREYAARALGRIGPDAKPAAPALLERLRKDEERDVREHAAKSLGLIGAQALGPLLAETVETLIKGLKDEAADVRENSARALGQLGATEALAALRQVARDPQERVRLAVAEALKRLEAAGADRPK